MRMAKLLGALAGALALGGCFPAYQSTSGDTIGVSPAAQRGILYGSYSPAETEGAVRRNVAHGASRPSADTALIYSDEWRKQEEDREARLRQSSTICRC